MAQTAQEKAKIDKKEVLLTQNLHSQHLLGTYILAKYKRFSRMGPFLNKFTCQNYKRQSMPVHSK